MPSKRFLVMRRMLKDGIRHDLVAKGSFRKLGSISFAFDLDIGLVIGSENSSLRRSRRDYLCKVV